MPKKVAVIGSGIAGLSAAYRLKQAGMEVTVFERNTDPGGRLKSVRDGGFTMDVGAAMLPSSYKDVVRLMDDAGLSQMRREVQNAICAIPRDGKFHYIDLKKAPSALLKTKLISSRSKFDLLKLGVDLVRLSSVLRFDSLGDAAEAGGHLDRESLKAYAQRKLNSDLLDYFLEPLIRVFFLHDADKGSALETLWALKNFSGSKSFYIAGGMDALARELAKQIGVRTSTSVERVSRDGNGVLVTYAASGSSSTSEAFDAAVVALDTKGIERVLADVLNERQKSLIADRQYAAVVSLHLQLRAAPKERSLLIQVPKGVDPFLAAIVQDSVKSADRAPSGKWLLGAFFTGEWGAKMYGKSDAEIYEDAIRRLRLLMPDVPELVEKVYVNRWEHGASWGELGVSATIKEFERLIDKSDPIQIASDLFVFSTVNVSVKQGEIAAERLIKKLRPA